MFSTTPSSKPWSWAAMSPVLVDPGALSYVETFIIRGLNDLPLRFRRRA